MSQLLCCPCGGQFVVEPQPQPTAWQCPHCGAVCLAPALEPAPVVAPPVVTPRLPPLVASRPTLAVDAAPPPDRSPFSAERLPKTILLGGGGLISALVLFTVARNVLSSVPAPRPKAVAVAKAAPQVAVAANPQPAVDVSKPPEVVTAPPPEDPAEEMPAEPPPPRTYDAPLPELPPLAGMPPPRKTEIPARLIDLVRSHCVDCHDAKSMEGGLRLDDLVQRPLQEQNVLRWRRILTRVTRGEMPPKDSPPLAREDHDYWTDWLRAELFALAADTPRPTVRRLNRNEYVNSVRFLTGLPLEPAAVVDDVITSGFDTDAGELNLSPQLLKQYVQIARAVAAEIRKLNPRIPNTKLKLFGEADDLVEESAITAEARKRLELLATAAFRRPVEEHKLSRLAQLVAAKKEAGKTFDDGMQVAVQAVFSSPQFLLLEDLNDVSDDYALASKLSYFLWSGPPDPPLLDLAAKQTLHTDEKLKEQVTRMLKDPRARALADNFGGQWLGTRELGVMQPDEDLFPDYTPLVEASFREETHRYFEHVLRQNLSITAFLDSDFTFVNEPLSRVYGIPNVRGNEFRKVSLNPQQHRGGILTQATMLSITSDGVRSSPVIRGVWILENILGDPPSPPPANVPDLEADTRGTKSIREELAKHRHIESCNSCHKKIDPLGFALENFDAVGQWRTHYRTEKDAQPTPVDNAGELPDGTKLAGLAPLKKALLQRKREFARCVTEKLLSYGCSRKLDIRDDAVVEQIVQATAAGDWKLQNLIQAIVQSETFRGKQSESPSPDAE